MPSPLNRPSSVLLALVCLIAAGPPGRLCRAAGVPGSYPLPGGEELVVQGLSGKPDVLRGSPDGRLLAAHGGGLLQLYSVPQRSRVRVRFLPVDLQDLAFLSGPTQLCVLARDGLAVYDPAADRVTAVVQTDDAIGPTTAVAVAPAVRRVLVARRAGAEDRLLLGRIDDNGKVALDRQPLAALPLHARRAALSANGKFAAVYAGGKKGKLFVVDCAAGRVTRTFDADDLESPYRQRPLWVTGDGARVIGWTRDAGFRFAPVVFDARTGGRHALADPGQVGLLVAVRDDDHVLLDPVAGDPRSVDLAGRLAAEDDPARRQFKTTFLMDFSRESGHMAGVNVTGEIALRRLDSDAWAHLYGPRVQAPTLVGRAPGLPVVYLGVKAGPSLWPFDRVVALDLSTGEARELSEEERRSHPPALLSVGNGGRFQVDDLTVRQMGKGPGVLPIEGLRDDDTLEPVPGRPEGADWCVAADAGRVVLVDLAAARVRREFRRPPPEGGAAVPALRFAFLCARADVLLTADEKGTLEAWGLSDGRRRAARRTDLKPASLSGAVESPDGKALTLLGTGEDVEVALSDDLTTRRIGDAPAVRQGRLLADGRTVLWSNEEIRITAAGARGAPAAAPAATAPAPRVIPAPPLNPFLNVVVLEDLHRAVTCGANGAVAVWDLETGERLADCYLRESGDVDRAWVTPDGYYSGSPRGLMGLARVRGLRASFPDEEGLERNRPALVLRRIGLADPARLASLTELESRRAAAAPATREAGEAPTVRLTSPLPITTGERELSLAWRAEGGAPPARVYATVNGVPVGSRDGLPVVPAPATQPGTTTQSAPAAPPGPATHPATEGLVKIPLGPGENRISLRVADGAGRRSAADSAVVDCTAAFPAGKVYLLAAGISEYRDERLRLKYPAKDAGDVAAALDDVLGGRARVLLLTDEKVTRDGLAAARPFLEQAGPGDQVIVYLAGHGTLEPRTGYQFLPWDYDLAAATTNGAAGSNEAAGVGAADLERLVDGLRAGQRWVILDTCHSGAGDAGPARVVNVAPDAAPVTTAPAGRGIHATQEVPAKRAAEFDYRVADLRDGTGATVIGAASSAQLAYEGKDGQNNGAFTHAFVTALRHGDGVDDAGDLRLSGLLRVVADRVRAVTGGAQSPSIKQSPFGFDFALVAGPRPERLADLSAAAGEQIFGAAVTPDGRFAAVLCSKGLVRVDLEKRAVLETTPLDEIGPAGQKPLVALLLSPDGSRAAVTWGLNESYARDLRPGGHWVKLTSGKQPLYPWLFAGPGQPLIASGRNGGLYALDLTGEPRKIAGGQFEAVSFSPATGRVVAVAGNGVVELDPAPGAGPGKVTPVPAGRHFPAGGGQFRTRLSDTGAYAARVMTDLDGPEAQAKGGVVVFRTADGKVACDGQAAAAEELVIATPDGPIRFEGPFGSGRQRILNEQGTELLARRADNVMSFGPILSGGDAIAVRTPVDLNEATAFGQNAQVQFTILDRRTGRARGWMRLPGDFGDALSTADGRNLFVDRGGKVIYRVRSLAAE